MTRVGDDRFEPRDERGREEAGLELGPGARGEADVERSAERVARPPALVRPLPRRRRESEQPTDGVGAALGIVHAQLERRRARAGGAAGVRVRGAGQAEQHAHQQSRHLGKGRKRLEGGERVDGGPELAERWPKYGVAHAGWHRGDLLLRPFAAAQEHLPVDEAAPRRHRRMAGRARPGLGAHKLYGRLHVVVVARVVPLLCGLPGRFADVLDHIWNLPARRSRCAHGRLRLVARAVAVTVDGRL
mmetsp:Transcript_4482/g.11831  ORF Transcript_4482/g.11831 Transcript_4482/m.11831 type:complete len:245 (-) Transcript_4482:103-837(-)